MKFLVAAFIVTALAGLAFFTTGSDPLHIVIAVALFVLLMAWFALVLDD